MRAALVLVALAFWLSAPLARAQDDPRSAASRPVSTASRGGAALDLASIATLDGHTRPILCLAFEPNGATLASGGLGEQVIVWDVRKRRELRRPVGFECREHLEVTAVGFNRGAFFGAVRSDWGNGFGRKRITFLENGTEDRRAGEILIPATRSPTCAAIDAKGKYLAVGGEDRVIRVYDLATVNLTPPDEKKPVPTPEVQPNAPALPGMVNCVAWHPVDPVLVVGCSDGSLRLFKIAKGVRPVSVAFAPAATESRAGPSRRADADVTSVRFSDAGRQVLASTAGGHVTAWNSATGEVTSALEGSTSGVRALAVDPKFGRFATGDAEGQILVRDMKSYAVLAARADHTGAIRALAFSPDGKLIASGGDDLKVRLFEIKAR